MRELHAKSANNKSLSYEGAMTTPRAPVPANAHSTDVGIPVKNPHDPPRPGFARFHFDRTTGGDCDRGYSGGVVVAGAGARERKWAVGLLHEQYEAVHDGC